MTIEAQIHLLLAAAAFTAIAFAAPTISSRPRSRPDDRLGRDRLGGRHARHARGEAAAGVFGLVERILYVAFISWLVVMASSLSS